MYPANNLEAMPVSGLSAVGLTEIGAAGTLGILLVGLYSYLAGKLTTAKEREDRLKNLEGKAVKQGKFIIGVDNVEFDERTGFFYRIKRLLLRPIDGSIYVIITLKDIGVPPDLWDMDHADAFYDTLDFPVECVNSQLTSQHTALVFQLQSAEYLDLKQFLDHLSNFFQVMEDSGTISVVGLR